MEGHPSNLEVADGGFVASQGSALLDIKVGQCILKQRFIIAEMTSPVILGFDFIRDQECIIDGGKALVWVGGELIPCQARQDAPATFRVTLDKTITVPALTERLVEANINGHPHYTCAIMEPSEALINRKQILIAKSVVDPGGGKIFLRIANLQDEPVTLYRRTVAGTCSALDEIPSEVTGRVSALTSMPTTDQTPPHLHELLRTSSEKLSPEQQNAVRRLLQRQSQVFSVDKEDIGRTHLVQHKIPTGDATPIRQHPRRLPYKKRDDCAKEVQRMLEMGVITPSVSPWASPVVMVKKADDSWRFCLDYRKVNGVTKKDSYPLPRIDDTLDALSGSKWFSTVDLSSGYWQVEMDAEDAEKTAFCVTGGGLYQFNVLPFGLTSAGATFERLMERVLAGLHWETCLVYLDDVIIFGKDFDTHLSRLDEVLTRIHEAGLKISPMKSRLFRLEVDFLGHNVSENGISTSLNKTKSIDEWKTPSCVKEVRSFAGLCSYYRRFVKNFADIAKPLYQLMEKGAEFKWSPECDKAFTRLKEQLTTAPVLAFPRQDLPYILDTDASGIALGCVLSQEQEGIERVIAYHSRTFSREERRYCVTRRELLAIVEALKHYHHYVYGTPTTVRTDHGALTWLMQFKNPEGQTARWLEVIGTYPITIKHRPGRLHGNADALSRRPCEDCGHCERQEVNVELPIQPARIRTVARKQLEGNKQVDPDHNDWVEGWSNEDLRAWQQEDPVIGKVARWVETGDRPPWADVKTEGSHVRDLWSKWEELELHRAVLYRRYASDGEPEPQLKLIAPKQIRSEIMEQLHDNRTSGHVGNKKTAFNVRRRFWWPGSAGDVENWCRECQQCQFRNKRGGRRNHPLVQDAVGSPLERVAMDILSLPTASTKGNTCILVVGDYFTKWVEAFALPDHQAMTVADVLVTEIFMRLGTPRMLHSDQGPEFRSELMSALCNLLGIKKTQTAPYHPRSDGLIERFNRTLLNMLSKLCTDRNEDWDEHLPYVMGAYRATIQDSTGFSPNRMMLARETTMPIDLMYPSVSENSPYGCPVEYVNWVQDTLQENYERAREHLRQAAQRQKQHFDARASPRKLQVGCWVLRFYPPQLSRDKLNPSYTGPYLVVKKVGEVNYLIQLDEKSTPLTIHIDDLKLYHGQNTPASWLMPPHKDQAVQWENPSQPIDINTDNDDDTAVDVDTHSDIDTDVLGRDSTEVIDNSSRTTRSGRTFHAPNRFGWD